MLEISILVNRLQISAVAGIRHQLSLFGTQVFHFFYKNGFLYVHTLYTYNNYCEAAGDMFQVTALFSQGAGTVPRKDGGMIRFQNGNDSF